MDWKKVSHYVKYGLYVVPLYGLYDQLKRPKKERSKAGVIFSDIVLAGLVIKLGLLYGGKVAATGDWNPFHFNSKDKTEQIDGVLENKKNLENCLDYEELTR